MQQYKKEDDLIQKTARYLNKLETFLKFAKDKNKALIEYFTTLKDIQNTTANAIKAATGKFSVS